MTLLATSVAYARVGRWEPSACITCRAINTHVAPYDPYGSPFSDKKKLVCGVFASRASVVAVCTNVLLSADSAALIS
jgi:hypothetical protein